MKGLIFGSSGALGTAIVKKSHQNGWETFLPAREIDFELLKSNGNYSFVIWAQGANQSDSIDNLNYEYYSQIIDANLNYIINSLKFLLENELLESNSKLCILSSIWENISRNSKFSYCVSKSALSGFIKSSAIDLGKKNIIINSILPGVVDSPMTLANMNKNHLDQVINQTPLRKISKPEDIASLACFLIGPENKMITGQSIVIDGGYSFSRIF